MKNKKNFERWYWLLGGFLFPPLWIYSGLKSTRFNPMARTLLAFSGVMLSILWLFWVLGMIFGNAINYQLAEAEFDEGKYEEAYKHYSLVSTDYTPEIETKRADALYMLTRERNAKKNRLNELKKAKKKKQDSLKEAKHAWADSIMDYWDGKFLVGYTLEDDYIVFNLSKKATKYYDESTGLLRDDYASQYEDSGLGKAEELVFRLDPEQKQLDEARDAKVYSQFSIWDGHHIKLKDYVLARMKNPDSFKHIETSYTDKGDRLEVFMVYRGENSFGGYTRENVKGVYSLDGEMLAFKVL